MADELVNILWEFLFFVEEELFFCISEARPRWLILVEGQ